MRSIITFTSVMLFTLACGAQETFSYRGVPVYDHVGIGDLAQQLTIATVVFEQVYHWDTCKEINILKGVRGIHIRKSLFKVNGDDAYGSYGYKWKDGRPPNSIRLALIDHKLLSRTALYHEFIHHMHNMKGIPNDPGHKIYPEDWELMSCATAVLKGKMAGEFWNNTCWPRFSKSCKSR